MTTCAFVLVNFALLAVTVIHPHATKEQVRELLLAHNAVRAQVGTPPLAWSTRLALRAEEWAFLLIEQNRFGPRRDGVFGENVYELTGGTSLPLSSPAEVVRAWASERVNFNPATGSCSGRCGHYTQVVWRDTRFVGCGAARDSRREVWVCNYDPHGNVAGERPY